MANIVFPTENDIGGSAGDGSYPLEANLRNWLETLRPYSYLFLEETTAGEQIVGGPGGVVGGLGVSSVGLTATVAAGEANVKGRRVSMDAANVALTASKYNHIFLVLTEASGLVTAVAYQSVPTDDFEDLGSIPSNSILLHTLQTDGSAVLSKWDWRQFTTACVAGKYIGDGTNGRDFTLAFQPKQILIIQRGAGGIVSWSSLPLPQASALSKGVAFWEPSAGEPLVGLLTNDRHYVAERATTFDGFLVDGASAGTLEVDYGLPAEEKTWDPASIASGAVETTTITVTGAEVGDLVIANHTTIDAIGTMFLRGYVSAADTVTAVAINHAAVSSNPPSGTLRVRVFKQKAAAVSLNTSGEEYDWVAWS